MAKRKGSQTAATNDATKCQWCHYSPFRRTVHLLDMLEKDRGTDLRAHLRQEFAHQGDANGFVDAELRSVDFVKQYHSGNWRDWQANKMNSMGIARISDWLDSSVSVA